MADNIHVYRRAVADHVAKQVGLSPDQPTRTVANQYARGSHSDVYALPVDAANWRALQVLDTGSSDLGRFYFLPDYSVPGGPDIVL